MDEDADTYAYDTQPDATDSVTWPSRTQSYHTHNQPPGARQPGLDTLANQTTVQAQPMIHPIYQPPPDPQAGPPVAPVVPPPPLQPIPPQGTTLPATRRAPTIAPQTRGMSASAISVILGLISFIMGLVPACGVVALIPGLLGVFYGWRGMRTRKRNLALVGLLLSVVGIVLAFAVVV